MFGVSLLSLIRRRVSSTLPYDVTAFVTESIYSFRSTLISCSPIADWIRVSACHFESLNFQSLSNSSQLLWGSLEVFPFPWARLFSASLFRPELNPRFVLLFSPGRIAPPVNSLLFVNPSLLVFSSSLFCDWFKMYVFYRIHRICWVSRDF